MPRGRVRQGVVLGAACGLLLAISVTGTAQAIGISSSKCRPVGSKTIAIEARARVYSLPLRGKRAEQNPEDVRVLGCLFNTGHALPLGTTRGNLGDFKPSAGAVNPKVAAATAPFAAYSTESFGIDFNQTWVIVRNLNTGEVLQTANASPKIGVEPESFVTDMVVTNSGKVAWISQGGSLAGGHRGGEVALSAPSQPTEVLEEGDGIDSDSLELHGSRLTWTSEGIQHSAEMP